MEQPPQRQHLLAQSNPCRHRSIEPSNLESQGQAQLTGTTDVLYDTNNAASKIKHSLASNFYAILSLPPCQVEAQATKDSNITTERGKGRITFRLPTDQQQHSNKITERWK
jgi:hypothetical protein